MLEYVTIGVRDLQRAAEFYDTVLAPLRCARCFEDGRFVAYGAGGSEPGRLYLALPYDLGPPSPGNGSMTALTAASRAEVRASHAAALASGGRDEGSPGVREEYAPDFYAAYVRDLDGNKLAIVSRTLGESVEL